MAISRQKKEEIIKDLEQKFSDFKSVVFVNYSGVGVGDLQNIRKELREVGVDLKVAKKTLLDLVLRKHNIPVNTKSLEGQIAVVFGYKDEVMPAKIIYKFTKKLEKLKILAGILDKEFIGQDKVVSLAQIPSYEELLAKMVGSMQAPISGFVNVMQGNIGGLVQVLNQISKKV
jgi:large subunit ribosomal protein L10